MNIALRVRTTLLPVASMARPSHHPYRLMRQFANAGRHPCGSRPPNRAIGQKTPIMLLNHVGATSPPP